jgi:thiamine-phosphate pyrophosphorylase
VRLHAIVQDLDTAERAVAGGATVIQLRLKGMPTAEVVAAGRALRVLPATFVVNDDVEAAIELEADGVHLGRSDMGSVGGRGAGRLLGLSASSVQEGAGAVARGAAYVGAGPVWATPS